MPKRKPKYDTAGMVRAFETVLYHPSLKSFRKACVYRKWISSTTWFQVLQKLGCLPQQKEDEEEWQPHHFARSLAHKKSRYRVDYHRYDKSNKTGVFRTTFRYNEGHYFAIVEQAGSEHMEYPVRDEEFVEQAQKNEQEIHQFLEQHGDNLSHDLRENEFYSWYHEPGAYDCDSNETEDEEEGDESLSSKPAAAAAAPVVHQEEEKGPTLEELNAMTFWDSTEANKLFLPRETDKSALTALHRRIQLLRLANQSEDGWRHVVEGHDPDNLCTQLDIFLIRQKASLLCAAYVIASQGMTNGSKNWGACCQEAGQIASQLFGYKHTNPRFVSGCNSIFRENEKFPNPALAIDENGESNKKRRRRDTGESKTSLSQPTSQNGDSNKNRRRRDAGESKTSLSLPTSHVKEAAAMNTERLHII